MAERRASRSPSPPPTGQADLGVSTTPTTRTRRKSHDYDASNDALLETLYREKVLLQKQLDDERRLRREAEEIIDQRQDEVYERDAQIREMRSRERSRERRRRSSSKEKEKEKRRRRSSARRESSDSGERRKEDKSERSEDRKEDKSERSEEKRNRLSPDDAGDTGRRRSGSSTKRRPVASTATTATTATTTPPTSISLPTSPSTPTPVDPGMTKPQAVAAYAALITSVKSFVEARLSPVFAVKTNHLETIVTAVQAATNLADSDSPPSTSSSSTDKTNNTYYTMSKPRALLRLMSPRARMFLRLKGADSVHFYAILMEFLRRRVFAELYGGIFKTSSGPVMPLPFTTTSTASATKIETNVLKEWLLAENARQSVSKVEARIAEADELAARLGVLLNDVDPAYTGPRVNWRQATAAPQDPSVGSTTATTATTSKSTRPRHHQHSVSDGASPAVSLPPRQSPLRAEARLLRVQLLDRILRGRKTTTSSPSTSSSFSSSSSRISGLSSYIDTRVLLLSADLARVLLPLQLALGVAKKMGANLPMVPENSVGNLSGPTAKHARDVVDTRAITYASLERAVATEVVRPAVELAVALQLALPEYAVRRVEHPQDSPSLSVCEAFGLDDQRIQFAKSSSSESQDQDQYSFVFDISPALYMMDPSSKATVDDDSADIIYAQGVLLQKGEVATEKTFVHWLHETGIKPKGESPIPNKTKMELYQYFAAKPPLESPVDWRRKTSGERERERERERVRDRERDRERDRDDDRRRRPIDGS